MRARRDSQLVRAVLDSTESFSWTWTSWAVLRLSLLTDCWTILIRPVLGASSVRARGEFSDGHSYWLVAACSVSGASLLQEMLLIGLIRWTGYVCQYGVFYYKN